MFESLSLGLLLPVASAFSTHSRLILLPNVARFLQAASSRRHACLNDSDGQEISPYGAGEDRTRKRVMQAARGDEFLELCDPLLSNSCTEK